VGGLQFPFSMNTPEQHIAVFAPRFVAQERFRQVSFRVSRTGTLSILAEGYVSTVADFHALKAEWEATSPPCTTSIFVHINPLR